MSGNIKENIIIRAIDSRRVDRPIISGVKLLMYGINFRINMDHKGDLITCNRNLFKNSKFGNIHEQSFIDIWNSEQRKKIFKAIEDQIGIPDCARFCQTSFDNMIIEQELRNESLVL